MNLNEALKLPSLTGSLVMAGRSRMNTPITGVMVLEALDVEKWSRPGEIILTSYFALKDLPEEDLKEFIKKLSACEISALAVKPERLLFDIPQCLIESCEEYGLPLLQIPKDTKYETIILEILSPIINSNAAILDKHYSVHQMLMKFAMKEPSLEEILRELKRLISYDISLINTSKGLFVSTAPAEGSFRIIGKWPLPPSKYMNFNYFHNRILLGSSPDLASSELFSADWIGVSIPNVDNEDFELLIHNNGILLTSDDFMTVENFVFFLQMEFLKRHSVEQNLFLHANALVNELLQENLYSAEKVDSALDRLHLNHYPRYQAMALRLILGEDSPSELESWRRDQSHRIFHTFLTRLKTAGYDTAFEEKEDSLTLIVNFRQEAACLSSGMIRSIFSSVRQEYHEFSFQYDIAISNETNRFHLPDAGRQILEIQRLMRLFGKHGNILSYDDLGIYKIFLSGDNLSRLDDFIPQKFQVFSRDYPELSETLSTYLDAGQNLSETAKRLYLHAKTIHYRMKKIQDILNFDFDDSEQVLQAQIAFRLLKLLRQED
ncbi:PucR family transcriptional regulator [Clostridium sp. AM58-1XD]|uniref:PucR family transcriptional regulator n=1 Tax=Clostridium sp. AM58-1XD TaxID=2292307 RepID=UPI000E49C560|nr:PucR family transcriptional regulator [Clostridium sp. AM58-1XD]RGY97166.1 PucR family transcriptional regulator [Clostridium sp. AM58-1XD]